MPQKYEDNTSYMMEKSAWRLKSPEYYHRYLRLKEIYEHSINELNSNSRLSKKTIPQIMHYVWPGSIRDKIPSKFLYHIGKCQLMHQDWEHRIWYEEDILKENFDSIDLYQKAKSYAERADIMRYEILYKYGGFYLDTDVDCIKKLDRIADNFAVWLNSEPGEPLIFNGVMASYKNNSLFSDTIKIIHADYDKNTQIVTDLYQGKRNILLFNHSMAYHRTLKPLSKAFDINNNDDGEMLILPSRYAVAQKLRSNSFEGVWEKIQQKSFFLSSERLFVPDYVLVHHAARISGGQSYMLSPKLKFAMGKNVHLFSSWWKYRQIKNTDFENVVSFLYYRNYPDNKKFSVTNLLPTKIFLFGMSQQNQALWKNNLFWASTESIAPSKYDAILNEAGFKKEASEEKNRFLAQLITIYNKGGIVVAGDLVPKFNFLWELFYKYNRFYVLEPLGNDHVLNLSPLIFGGQAGDRVIGSVLAKLKNYKFFDAMTIRKLLEQEIIHNISFISADSSTIIFPPVNFFGDDKRNMSFTYEK